MINRSRKALIAFIILGLFAGSFWPDSPAACRPSGLRI